MSKIDFDPKKLTKVDIKTISPNTWNPKDLDTDEYQKVLKSIKTKGLRGFVAVREHDGGYEIIDGQQRYTAAKELGYSEIVVYNEGDVSDQEARELTIWYQQQVPFNHTDLAFLVTDMMNEYGEIELPYSTIEIKEFQELAGFDFSQYDNETEGTDPDEVKTINIKVNANQYDIIMKAINNVKDLDDCSDGQALERICATYLSGPNTGE